MFSFVGTRSIHIFVYLFVPADVDVTGNSERNRITRVSAIAITRHVGYTHAVIIYREYSDLGLLASHLL